MCPTGSRPDTVGRVPDPRFDPALHTDAQLVSARRAGEETAFAGLVEAGSPGMLRAARAYVGDALAAEDEVQEPWIAGLRGIDRFAARASLRTCTYRIR